MGIVAGAPGREWAAERRPGCNGEVGGCRPRHSCTGDRAQPPRPVVLRGDRSLRWPETGKRPVHRRAGRLMSNIVLSTLSAQS